MKNGTEAAFLYQYLSRWSHASLLCLAAILTACSIAPNLEVNHAALKKVKRIAVVDLGLPNIAMVQNYGIAAGFGVIGGAAEGASNADKSKVFSAAIAEHKPSLNEALVTAVANGLSQAGYEVIKIEQQRPRFDTKKQVFDVSNVPTDADAILLVWAPLSGYVSPPQSSSYRSQVMIKCQVSSRSGAGELYLKTFFVGYKAASISADCLALPSGLDRRYKDFEELRLNAGSAVDELIACEKIGAAKIVEDLSAP